MVMGHAAMCDTPHASSRLGSLAVQFLLDIVPRLVPAASKKKCRTVGLEGDSRFLMYIFNCVARLHPQIPGLGLTPVVWF